MSIPLSEFDNPFTEVFMLPRATAYVDGQDFIVRVMPEDEFYRDTTDERYCLIAFVEQSSAAQAFLQGIETPQDVFMKMFGLQDNPATRVYGKMIPACLIGFSYLDMVKYG